VGVVKFYNKLDIGHHYRSIVTKFGCSYFFSL